MVFHRGVSWILHYLLYYYINDMQELCKRWGGRPGLPILMSLMVSVDVKQHWTTCTHWSQFVPNMSTRHPRTLSSTSSLLCPKNFKQWMMPVQTCVQPVWCLQPSVYVHVCQHIEQLKRSVLTYKMTHKEQLKTQALRLTVFIWCKREIENNQRRRK